MKTPKASGACLRALDPISSQACVAHLTPLCYVGKFGLTRVGPPSTKSWIRPCNDRQLPIHVDCERLTVDLLYVHCRPAHRIDDRSPIHMDCEMLTVYPLNVHCRSAPPPGSAQKLLSQFDHVLATLNSLIVWYKDITIEPLDIWWYVQYTKRDDIFYRNVYDFKYNH